MLILPIKKKWFDLIKSGDKKTEYRDFKDYYKSRFKDLRPGSLIMLRNGYSSKSPFVIVRLIKIEIVNGLEADYLVANNKYFALRIMEILKNESPIHFNCKCIYKVGKNNVSKNN